MTALRDPSLLNRRGALNRIGLGFGGLALNALLSERAGAAAQLPAQFPARAKRVIFLFMHGGPSHIDLFDYKPKLEEYNGKPLPFAERKVQFSKRGNLLKPPWKLRQVGNRGHWMSELWQHLPKVADELCMLHSLCETNVSHGGACMKMHTGDEALLRPSMGAWVSYGLGTENNNLPGFVTICPTSLHGGANNFGPAFLPAEHGGVPLGAPGYPNTPSKDAPLSEKRKTDTSCARSLKGLLQPLTPSTAARQAGNARSARARGKVIILSLRSTSSEGATRGLSPV